MPPLWIACWASAVARPEGRRLTSRGAAPDCVTQWFTISGTDRGTPFHCAAVDLYAASEGRIVNKDTYWKQPGN